MNAPITPEVVTEAKPLNIYQRLNQVRAAVAYVQKDKKVEGQGYMAVTHDAVTSLVRPHLVEQSIIVVPTLVTSKVAETGTVTAKGTPIIRYEATYDVAFVNADSPDDRVLIRQEAHALDQGDKAPGKATSYAVKYSMLKLFSLETGEEEESRIEQRAKKSDGNIAVGPGVHRPSDGVEEALSEPQRRKVMGVVEEAKACYPASPLDCLAVLENAKFEPEESIYAWLQFDSKERAAMKAAKAKLRAA